MRPDKEFGKKIVIERLLVHHLYINDIGMSLEGFIYLDKYI